MANLIAMLMNKTRSALVARTLKAKYRWSFMAHMANMTGSMRLTVTWRALVTVSLMAV